MKVTINDAPVVAGGFRYEPGETYQVDTETGGLFKGMGWAVSAAKDAEVAEPLRTHDATDKDAEQVERETKERAARIARQRDGEQEPDLDVQDGQLGSSSTF